MNENTKVKTINKESLCSDKQGDLITQMQEETGIQGYEGNKEVWALTKEEASTVIDALKKYKVQSKNPNNSILDIPKINDAAFGMAFKLAWRYVQDSRVPEHRFNSDVKTITNATYRLYQETRTELLEEVQDGAV